MSEICAIAVMAKAPRAGKVKTRLVPPLSPDEAMAISGSFLQDVTANIALARLRAPIAGYVAFAPAGTEALFDGLLAPETGLVLADGSGDMPPAVTGFGRCLLHAARTLFGHGFDAVCLLNSDGPTLPTELLVQAAEALAAEGDRVVLGPAEDGGYYLIGMKAPHPHLFENVTWSTDLVCGETEQRVAALGLELVRLAPWYDVDDQPSLMRLIDELGALRPGGLLPYAAPATARTVAALDFTRRLRRHG